MIVTENQVYDTDRVIELFRDHYRYSLKYNSFYLPIEKHKIELNSIGKE